VIQADGDPATQYDGGPAMAAALGDQLISVRDSGEHGQYGNNPCVTEKIDDYLINGVLPRRGPSALPNPVLRSHPTAPLLARTSVPPRKSASGPLPSTTPSGRTRRRESLTDLLAEARIKRPAMS
jgi:PAB1-binding protein PBP1